MKTAQQIINELTAMGITKYHIASKTNSTWQTVNYWDRGIYRPTPEKMAKLRKLYRQIKKNKLYNN